MVDGLPAGRSTVQGQTYLKLVQIFEVDYQIDRFLKNETVDNFFPYIHTDFIKKLFLNG